MVPGFVEPCGHDFEERLGGGGGGPDDAFFEAAGGEAGAPCGGVCFVGLPVVFGADAEALSGFGVDEFDVALARHGDFHGVEDLEGEDFVSLLAHEGHFGEEEVFLVEEIGDEDDEAAAFEEVAGGDEFFHEIRAAAGGVA